MALPVALFLVLFLPALLIMFTCVMSCVMMFTPKVLPPSAMKRKQSVAPKPPLSLSIGAGGEVESNFDDPVALESGLKSGVDVDHSVEGIEEPEKVERLSIVSPGTLMSDGTRAGTPKARGFTPRGFGRSSPRISDPSPGRISDPSPGRTPPSISEVEIVELPLA